LMESTGQPLDREGVGMGFSGLFGRDLLQGSTNLRLGHAGSEECSSK
jgi:hypothetical protein